MNKVFLFILIAFLFSCGNEKSMNDHDMVIAMNDPGIPVHILIDSIENYGSVNAFHRLFIASLDSRPEEFLSTFRIMADKYNNAFACMTVYYKVVEMYNIPVGKSGIYNLDLLNNDARKMAVQYLIKADSLGNKEAKDHLREYKKIGMIK